MFDASMPTAPSLAPHVLAVDGHSAIRELVSDYLTGNELRVTAVARGTELTAVMERETIDLVVLDLRFLIRSTSGPNAVRVTFSRCGRSGALVVQGQRTGSKNA